MIKKIKKLLKLWPFHCMKLGRLTRHWLAQRGALDAVYEMYMDYWREYVEPLGHIGSILKEYSKPKKIDILMGEVHGRVTWARRPMSVAKRFNESIKIVKAEVEKEIREEALLLTETD